VNYLPEDEAAQWPGAPGDVLLTDIDAGTAIFGGAYPLIVGNPVNVYRGQNILGFSPQYPDIEIDDRIVIGVHVPVDWPDDLRIVNWVGGSVDWSMDATQLVLGSSVMTQDGMRSSSLVGPLLQGELAMCVTSEVAIGLVGGDARQCITVNARCYGTQA